MAELVSADADAVADADADTDADADAAALGEAATLGAAEAEALALAEAGVACVAQPVMPDATITQTSSITRQNLTFFIMSS